MKLFLFICSIIPLGLIAQDAHVGTWQTKIPLEDGTMLPLQVTLTAEGTFAVDFGIDGTVEIDGKYSINDGQITIQDTGGPRACTTGKGVYKLEVSATNMKMTRISDDCEGRGGPEGVMAWTKA